MLLRSGPIGRRRSEQAPDLLDRVPDLQIPRAREALPMLSVAGCRGLAPGDVPPSQRSTKARNADVAWTYLDVERKVLDGENPCDEREA